MESKARFLFMDQNFWLLTLPGWLLTSLVTRTVDGGVLWPKRDSGRAQAIQVLKLFKKNCKLKSQKDTYYHIFLSLNTNISNSKFAPENGWLEVPILFWGKGIFSWALAVSFSECITWIQDFFGVIINPCFALWSMIGTPRVVTRPTWSSSMGWDMYYSMNMEVLFVARDVPWKGFDHAAVKSGSLLVSDRHWHDVIVNDSGSCISSG